MGVFEKIGTKFKIFYRGFVFNNYRKSELLRKIYWDERAQDIQQKYNAFHNDFDFLHQVLEEVKPLNLLEIGCGSGRLLPVYLSLPFVKTINLQDISDKALELIDSADKRIFKTSESILALDKILSRQDIIVSNRVLQHIPPPLIRKNIEKICQLSDTVYINELSNSDEVQETSYMNRHDYESLFSSLGFKRTQTGTVDRQTIIVFKKGQ